MVFVVQDKWLDNQWDDHAKFNTIEEALKMLTDRLSNKIWQGDNNERSWRLVQRTIIDKAVYTEGKEVKRYE